MKICQETAKVPPALTVTLQVMETQAAECLMAVRGRGGDGEACASREDGGQHGQGPPTAAGSPAQGARTHGTMSTEESARTLICKPQAWTSRLRPQAALGQLRAPALLLAPTQTTQQGKMCPRGPGFGGVHGTEAVKNKQG